MSRQTQPKWWQLYLVMPLLVLLFAVDHQFRISDRGHQMVQLGIILVVFGLVHLWLRANASALTQMDQRQAQGTMTVIHFPAYRSLAVKRANLRLPDSEIKGVLSDTFEMDYIDAESFPIDEISQKLNKE